MLLPEPVKAYISAGKLSAGAARMLIGAPDPDQMAREMIGSMRRAIGMQRSSASRSRSVSASLSSVGVRLIAALQGHALEIRRLHAIVALRAMTAQRV